jgi:proteasome lid subunit RPN8/RPN11
MERVALPGHLVEQLLEQARASPRREICGLITARDGQPRRCLAIPNVAQQPAQFFTMDPAGQIEAFRSMRERGEQLYAIYHSHPQGPARPSGTDIEQAAYPEALYLIVSLRGVQPPVLGAWRIRNGAVLAVELQIQAGTDEHD